MEQQKKHRRVVSFSDVKQDKTEDSTKGRHERSIMKDYYNSKESEFAASIAAAAYAIYSLEETRAEFEKRMVESFREDPATVKNNSFRKENNNKDGSNTNSFEVPNLGSLIRRSSDIGSRRRNSTRAIEITGVQQRGDRRAVGNKADAWEQARLAKINKWYEKTRDKIIRWEDEKKRRASIVMERRKAELERLKRINLLHHQKKIHQIEEVAGGARKQLKERKKNEEAYAKQQVKKINSTGRLPAQCFCFEY